MSIHDDFHDCLPLHTQDAWKAWLAYMRERYPAPDARLASMSWTWHPSALDCPGVRIEIRRL